jgi:hypothetical protein
MSCQPGRVGEAQQPLQVGGFMWRSQQYDYSTIMLLCVFCGPEAFLISTAL